MAKRKKKTMTQLGKQPPRYRFFLNPYEDLRFRRCPHCEGKTRQRKLPLVIHVDPMFVLSLNKTCRYCASCDLLRAIQTDVERSLRSDFGVHNREAVATNSIVR